MSLGEGLSPSPRLIEPVPMTSTATMRLTYQITGAVLLCFSIYVGVEALDLRYYTSLGPGPGFFSCWLALILGLVIGWLTCSREPTRSCSLRRSKATVW